MTELEQAKRALTEKRAEHEALSRDITEKQARLAFNRDLLSDLDKQLATAEQARKAAADELVEGIASDDYIKECRAKVCELRDQKEVTQELVDAYERSLQDAPRKLRDMSDAVRSCEIRAWRALCEELQSEIALHADLIRKAWAARIGSGGANSFETLGRIVCGALRGEECIYLSDKQLDAALAELAKEHGLL